MSERHKTIKEYKAAHPGANGHANDDVPQPGRWTEFYIIAAIVTVGIVVFAWFALK